MWKADEVFSHKEQKP